jgi:hypothetical protein
MNERIKELAEQAEIYAGELIDEGADYNQYPRYYTEKFAELIVRECVKSIEYTIQTNCDTDSEKMGCEFAISDLKERFGVN